MFHIGATSYIIPDDILPNVEFLAPQVDDIELMLFETDEYGSNLPDAALCARLNELAAHQSLTYTVHLPLDLRLGDGDEETHISLVKARRVIEATRALRPFAYTLHLDGRALIAEELPGASQAPGNWRALTHWQDNARRALEVVCGWLDEPERLCIENVERWNPEAFAPVVEALLVSRTIDIGHLWLQGADPLEHLARWVERTRVIHLHGIAERDHASLAHIPAEQLDPVIAFLVARFSGVVTLEVFNEADLASSQAALVASVRRVEDGESLMRGES
ncbi:MAG: xylose isomerase [Chloroflexi bacterium HGW-Chloroflexi-1]|nr:MAG: xylose isomerase [Chloroflexi bacterium HGW-Chloroflexi-1]